MGGGKGGGDKAAKAAGQAQAVALDKQIAEQRAAFEFAQGAYQPYQDSGLSALQQYRTLIGLGGQDAQNQAIQGMAQSPLYQAQLQQAEGSLLQNASATGGLRTGNTQQALASLGPQMLNQQYMQQVGLMGGMQEQGANVIGNLANIRSGQAAATGQAFANQGAAMGQSILAQQAAKQQSGSGATSGAISGASAGFMLGGPWGAAAGGVLGALGGK
jgi:hypothetical protein